MNRKMISMSFQDLIKQQFSETVIQEIAKTSEESISGIQTLLKMTIPALLSQFATYFKSKPEAFLKFINKVGEEPVQQDMTALLQDPKAGILKHFNVWNFNQKIFGTDLENVITKIAGCANTKESTTNSFLGIGALSTLKTLFLCNKEAKLDGSSLIRFVSEQKDVMQKEVPIGFDLDELLGHNATKEQEDRMDSLYLSDKDEYKSRNWLLPFIILVGLLLLGWYLMRGCNSPQPTTVINTEDTFNKKVTGNIDESGNWVSDWGVDKTLHLPDGTTMTVGENSTEYKLYQFISDNNFQIDTLDKTKNWIPLDRVFFQTGKSILTTESQEQLTRIATILKNFPQAAIKIGGYTDNTGNDEINLKVSQNRAEIVAKDLTQLGAGQGQITEAVGYGSQFPVASNETEEGRAQNRRVDLKVSMK